MNNSQNHMPVFEVNTTQLVVGAVLFGAGGLLGLAGIITGSSAMMSACRRWFQELEVPPSDVVRHKWGQTKAATMAGAHAWQHHNNGIPAHSSHA